MNSSDIHISFFCEEFMGPFSKIRSQIMMQGYVAVWTIIVYIHILLYVCNSYNIGMSDLPDMYAQNLRAAGLKAEGIHIRQITSAYVTTNM